MILLLILIVLLFIAGLIQPVMMGLATILAIIYIVALWGVNGLAVACVILLVLSGIVLINNVKEYLEK